MFSLYTPIPLEAASAALMPILPLRQKCKDRRGSGSKYSIILHCTLPVRSRFDVATLDAMPLRWRCASVALDGWFHAASTTITSRLERSKSVIKSRTHIIYMPRFHYADATIPLRSCRLRCVVVALSLRF